MKNVVKKILVCVMLIAVVCMMAVPVFAEESAPVQENAEAVETVEKDSTTSTKAIAAGICVAVVAAAAAVSMGFAIAKSADGISRQPEASGNIRTSLMLGLVFIETAIIYALIVAILIIFVL